MQLQQHSFEKQLLSIKYVKFLCYVLAGKTEYQIFKFPFWNRD